MPVDTKRSVSRSMDGKVLDCARIHIDREILLICGNRTMLKFCMSRINDLLFLHLDILWILEFPTYSTKHDHLFIQLLQ